VVGYLVTMLLQIVYRSASERIMKIGYFGEDSDKVGRFLRHSVVILCVTLP